MAIEIAKSGLSRWAYSCLFLVQTKKVRIQHWKLWLMNVCSIRMNILNWCCGNQCGWTFFLCTFFASLRKFMIFSFHVWVKLQWHLFDFCFAQFTYNFFLSKKSNLFLHVRECEFLARDQRGAPRFQPELLSFLCSFFAVVCFQNFSHTLDTQFHFIRWRCEMVHSLRRVKFLNVLNIILIESKHLQMMI